MILATALAILSGITPVTDWIQEQGTYRLIEGPRTFVVDPGNGGNVTTLAWNGRNILGYQSGSFRPAPQLQWPGGWPPPPQWVSNPYQPTLFPGRLHLDGQVDTRQMQPVKNFSFDTRDSAFVATYVVRNTAADSPRSVAPWEIIRLPGGSGTIQFFPVGQRITDTVSDFTPDREDSLDWIKDDGSRNNKILFRDGKEGWMAAVVDSILLVKVWKDVPLAQIPPKQGEIQVYLCQSPVFEEMENMGPWTAIPPKDSLVWTVRWYLRSIPAGTSKALGSPDLVRMARAFATGSPTSLARSSRISPSGTARVDIEGRPFVPAAPGDPLFRLFPSYPKP